MVETVAFPLPVQELVQASIPDAAGSLDIPEESTRRFVAYLPHMSAGEREEMGGYLMVVARRYAHEYGEQASRKVCLKLAALCSATVDTDVRRAHVNAHIGWTP